MGVQQKFVRSSPKPASLMVANGPPQTCCLQLKLQSIIAAEQQNGAVKLTLFALVRGETGLSTRICKKLGECDTLGFLSLLAKALKRACEASACRKLVTNSRNPI